MGEHRIMTPEARFGVSRAWAGLEAAARSARERRERRAFWWSVALVAGTAFLVTLAL